MAAPSPDGAPAAPHGRRRPGRSAAAARGHRRTRRRHLRRRAPRAERHRPAAAHPPGPLRRLRRRHGPRRPGRRDDRDRDGGPRPGRPPSTSPGRTPSTGLRNLLYAFQWWVFGAFAIFMWWRWLQEDVLERASPRGGWRPPGRFDAVSVSQRPVRRLPRAGDDRGRPARLLRADRVPGRATSRPRARRCSSGASTWSILWVAHGWIFIAYVVVSFLLWRQTRWSVPFAAAGGDRRADPAGDLLGRARRHPPDPRGAPRARTDRRRRP